MSNIILTLLSLLMLVGSVAASEFVYDDGYYWLAGNAYNRKTVRYGHGTRYEYHRVHGVCRDHDDSYDRDKQEYKEPTKVTPKDPGWRQKLLEIAEQRDAYRQEQQAAAQEHKEYIEAIKVLGLEGAPGVSQPQYGANPYGYSYVTQAEQGGTVYGYSYSDLSDVYGDTDLAALFQQASRLTENAQGLAGEANSGFQEIVSQEGANRARVAEILAKAQLLRSLDKTTTKVTTETKVFGTGDPPQETPALPPDVADRLKPTTEDLAAVIKANCIGCHSSATAAGKSDLFPEGVNMENYAQFTVPQKQATVQAVLAGSMPKDADPLTVGESALFFGDLQAAILNQGSATPTEGK